MLPTCCLLQELILSAESVRLRAGTRSREQACFQAAYTNWCKKYLSRQNTETSVLPDDASEMFLLMSLTHRPMHVMDRWQLPFVGPSLVNKSSQSYNCGRGRIMLSHPLHNLQLPQPSTLTKACLNGCWVRCR